MDRNAEPTLPGCWDFGRPTRRRKVFTNRRYRSSRAWIHSETKKSCGWEEWISREVTGSYYNTTVFYVNCPSTNSLLYAEIFWTGHSVALYVTELLRKVWKGQPSDEVHTVEWSRICCLCTNTLWIKNHHTMASTMICNEREKTCSFLTQNF